MEGVISLQDQRMIELMSYAVRNGISKNESSYWADIDYPRQALSNVRKGIQSFRVQHIINACNLTGASADWVLGLSPDMFRADATKPLVQTLREAVAEMEGKHHRRPEKWIDSRIVKNMA